MIKAELYALVTDGSDEKGLTETNPFTVQYFDTAKQKVSTPLLDMCGKRKLLQKLCLIKLMKFYLMLLLAGITVLEWGLRQSNSI